MAGVNEALRRCAECGNTVEVPEANAAVPCYDCGGEIRFLLFPALTRARRPAAAAMPAVGEAACYFHEQSVAAAACERCGRFLCGLCRIEWGSPVLCPACVGTAEKTTDLLTSTRTRYDNISLGLFALSIPMFVLSFLISPAAVAIGIVALRKPGSLVRRRKWRAWLGIALGLLGSLGWVWLIAYAVLKGKS
jgi:DNA-directed RNA polymerase subunit RPC12/RpoP